MSARTKASHGVHEFATSYTIRKCESDYERTDRLEPPTLLQDPQFVAPLAPDHRTISSRIPTAYQEIDLNRSAAGLNREEACAGL